MPKSFFLFFVFCLNHFFLFSQNDGFNNHEQAYGYTNKDKGSLYDLDDFFRVAVGEFNGHGVIGKFNNNAEAILWKSFKSVIPGSQSVCMAIYHDVLKYKYTIAGMCTDCVIGRKGQVAFMMVVDTAFNPITVEGKTLHYFYPTVDSFQVRNKVKLLQLGNLIYLAYEGDSGFGSDIYLHSLNGDNLSQKWRKQYNTNFFEQPVMLEFENLTIALGINGWGKSRILKISEKDGAIIKQFDFTDIPAQFAYMGLGNYAMAYLTHDSLRVSKIDTSGKETYIKYVKLNSNVLPEFAISAKSAGGNAIQVAILYNDISELPYNRSNNRVYFFQTAGSASPVEFILPENGTNARNIRKIVATRPEDLTLIGDRIDGNTNRPFYFTRSNLNPNPTKPKTWYNALCTDTSLIEKNSLKSYPNTLPKIENNVVYATKTNFQNKQVNLWMDIYRPYDHYAMDSKDKRPAYIYFHGSGYVFGGEDGGSELLQAAERGMIGIGVKYRLGRLPNSIPNADSLQSAITNSIQNTYRALQDARDALKFIVENADKYNIDKDKLFIAGFSAGGNIVLNYEYLETKNFEASIITGLGPLTAKTPVAGILSGAGPFNQLVLQGLATPLEYIDKSENTPLYMVHGTCDSTALYNYGNLFDPTTKGSVGSYAIACRKQSLGHPYHFTTIKGGDHGLGANADKIYESIFKWIKKEVSCGKPINACELFVEPNTKGACVNVPTCPSCTATPTHDQQSLQVKIYPNPTNQYCTIEFEEPLKPNQIRVLIYDVTGKQYNLMIDKTETKNIKINTTTLSAGIYFLKISNGDEKVYEGKMVKM